jgi:hypothetical protein
MSTAKPDKCLDGGRRQVGATCCCPTCHNFSMPTPSKFLVPSTGKRVTLSQLKRLKKEFQVEAMRQWFDDNYDAPDELPYDSSEGGYQWIWGGPYDAEEVLQDAFGGAIADETIEELASDLSDISGEWSGKPDDGDYDDTYLTELIASGNDPFLTLMASLEDIEDAAKISAGEKERKTLHKLLFANVIAAFETFLGDLFMKTLRKSDKYVEDFVFKTPHFQNTQIKLSSIFERFKKIDAEVRTHVLAHNWHMLTESAQMYKRAFNIKFPDTPTAIANGIRDRHNIVHRNGKTHDGVEGSWGLGEIQALKTAILDFAGNIDGQAKSLSSNSPMPSPADPIKI